MMLMEDLNVANLLETKSNRAARTEFVPQSNEPADPTAPTKWLKAGLVGTLASFVIILMGIAMRRK